MRRKLDRTNITPLNETGHCSGQYWCYVKKSQSNTNLDGTGRTGKL